MELLRFTTAGSVDDGKSTLIGRLLFDSKSVFEDQYESIRETSEKRGDEYVNLALLTDGLRAEREQGITIDVAYRYFATPKRKFIIADTPGHIQYTRNMVTGASTANLAIILVDARKGLSEQTRRHACIASLLRIPNLAVCINKMDLVDYSQSVFETICSDFRALAAQLGETNLHFIPICALHGDNVVNASTNMNWYTGPSLMQLLETIPVENVHNLSDARFPVQYVIRPQQTEFHDYRGYAGRVAGGVFKTGDAVVVLPSGLTSTIKSIDVFGASPTEAWAGQSVTITLADDIDICRGDMLVHPDNKPEVSQDITATICWMNEKPLQPSGKYLLKHTGKDVRCVVREVVHKIDISTLQPFDDDKTVGLNAIADIKLKTSAPLCFDPYTRNRTTGSFILIDEGTNETVAAGLIR